MERFKFSDRGIEDLVRLSPLESSGDRAMPGDLTKFAPMDFNIYRWKTKEQEWNPFLEGPVYGEQGGVIYFRGDRLEFDDFLSLTRVLNFSKNKDYSAYFQESSDVWEDGFVSQLRIVSRRALTSLFRSTDDKDASLFPQQDLSIPQLFWEFIQIEKEKYLDLYMGNEKLYKKYSTPIPRTFVSMNFGLMVENDYYNVYRIWSRIRLFGQ